MRGEGAGVFVLGGITEEDVGGAEGGMTGGPDGPLSRCTGHPPKSLWQWLLQHLLGQSLLKPRAVEQPVCAHF